MNYYPHHIGDYSRDTAHLSMLEDAAYRRMLDLYYASEKPLPLNREGLCRLVRARSEEEKLAVSVVLGEFFTETKKGWTQKRVEIEIAKGKVRTQAAQENGRKGGRPLTQQEPSNNPAGLRSETQIKAPKTKSQKPLTKTKDKDEVALRLPEWLPLEAWRAWLEVRKSKKAPNTPRALGLALEELTRLRSMGYDPLRVLDESTVKGWRFVYPLKVELLAVATEPRGKLCDYCAKVSTGMVNGRRACDADWDKAMSNTPPLKVAA